jgi:probable HAF family extracellular repeat protein
MTSRAILATCVIASIALAGCESSPTQPAPLAPPPASPPSVPPTPPPAPPVSDPWIGFVGTQADGFTSLSGLPAMTESFPNAINDSGEIAGEVAFGTDRRAFMWSSARGMEQLGTSQNGFRSVATGINANGDVVGTEYPPGGLARAFRWTRTDGMTELGGTPSYCIATSAQGINKGGEVVGSCLIDQRQTVYRPFQWTAGKGMEDLGTLDSDRGGVAVAINDRGEIVGFSNSASIYDDARSALWTAPGRVTQVVTCSGWCDSQATAVNQSGDVVGSANGAAFVRWHDGTILDIGGLPGHGYTLAVGIDDSGTVVGVSYPPNTGGNIRSFVWTSSGGMRELTVPGNIDVVVTGINNKGQIIGYAR